jgi:hypothetical protein
MHRDHIESGPTRRVSLVEGIGLKQASSVPSRACLGNSVLVDDRMARTFRSKLFVTHDNYILHNDVTAVQCSFNLLRSSPEPMRLKRLGPRISA